MNKNASLKDKKIPSPQAIFDNINFIKEQSINANHYPDFAKNDFEFAKKFLLSYDGNKTTFDAYRREVERLLQWSWLISKKSVVDLRLPDLEEYLNFCQKPPTSWVGLKKAPRFINQEEARVSNEEWKPFIVHLSKSEYKEGKKLNKKYYELSKSALQDILKIMGSFYNYLIMSEYTHVNPVLFVRQKSRYFKKVQGAPKIRRLSELHWHYVMKAAEIMTAEGKKVENDRNEKVLFILSAMYGMYLRISELTASERWIPKMSHFYQDGDGLWWFVTVGKGNKERHISVSDDVLDALRRYRKSLALSPLPSLTEQTPLIPTQGGKRPISSTNRIRVLVQKVFDRANLLLEADGFLEELSTLKEATTHWLRHTGISVDVRTRPREHIRDDAGHSSAAITDKYIDVERRERHQSGKKRILIV